MANDLMVQGKDAVRVVAVPHPFKSDNIDLSLPEGLTINQILEIVQPDEVLRMFAFVFVNEDPIYSDDWDIIKPAQTDVVTIKIVPMGGGGGGGGKNIGSAIKTIAIVAATVGLGHVAGQHLTGIALFGAKVAIGGVAMLAKNVLIPPRSTTPGMANLSLSSGSGLRESPTLFIEGATNTTRPYGVVPFALGVHKTVPPLLGRTWTEVIGEEEYLRMAVAWAYGRVDIGKMKIAETLISEFTNIEKETLEGASTDGSLTLFPDTILQENFAVLLKQVDSWTTRTSEINADELSVDVSFLRGLVTFSDEGARGNRTVTFEIQYRGTGTAGSWLNPNLSASNIAINTASVSIGVFYSDTSLVPGREPGVRGVVYKTVSFSENQLVLDPVTDTGSQQIITTGIKAFTTPGVVKATVAGGGTSIKAVQVTIDGTDTDDNVIQEVLPAFTEDTEGDVTGTKIFKTITQVTIPAQDTAIFEVTASNAKSVAVRYGFRWKVVSTGQYDVRIRRTTADTSDTQIFDELHWSALRTIRNSDPDNFSFKLAKTVLSIKATNQLSRMIDEFNGVVSSYALDWNSGTETWAEAITSNPASLFRHVLQSAAMESALADARIDLVTLQTWHTFCVTNGFEFNQIRDYQSSVWELLQDICIAGRAVPTEKDGKWSVIIDQAQTVAKQHFTDRNSSNFQGEKDFVLLPHGLRIRFANRNQNWASDEMIVYADGFDVTNATRFEQLDAIGITDPDHVWKHGRYHLAQMSLRPEVWTIDVDFEYLVAKRGDLVKVTHDMLLVGLASARITGLQTDANGDVTGFTTNEDLVMASGTTYGVSIRTLDDKAIVRTIVDNPGTQRTIVFTAVILKADTPVVNDLFGFGVSGSETIDAIITAIEPKEEISATLKLTPYGAAIYTADTGTIPAFDSKVTRQAQLPDVGIVSTRTDESVLRLGAGNTLIPRIGVTFTAIGNLFEASVVVAIRVTGSGQEFIKAVISEQTPTEVIIEDVEELQTYDIRLQWVSPGLLVSGPFSFANGVLVRGQTGNPQPLSGLNISSYGGTALLRWDALSDLDVRFGGEIRFRHSHELVSASASWSASVGIGTSIKGSAVQEQLPLKPGTYLARVFDKGMRGSTIVAIDTKQASVLTYANVTTVIEETAFSGTHTNTVNDSGVLKLEAVGLWDSIPDLDAVVDIDSYGGMETTGTYDFAAALDLTTVKKVRLTTDVNATVTNTIDKIDSWTGLVDNRDSWDGDVSGTGDARVQVRSTDDDPAGSPTWTAWNNLDSAEFTARGFEFRIILTSNDATFNILVTKLQVIVEEVT